MKNVLVLIACLSATLFSVMVFADGSISLKTEIKARSSNSQGAITVSSDSVFIKEHMQRFNNKSKAKKNSQNNVAKVSVNPGRVVSVSSKQSVKLVKVAKEEKQIIKLSTSKNLPKKENSTPGFIFKDITDRDKTNDSLISKIDSRQATVESLRHITLTR